jgi:hypothetical protein
MVKISTGKDLIVLTMLKTGLEIDKLNVLFSTHNLTTLAIQQGFMKRKPSKIDHKIFLSLYFLLFSNTHHH